MSQPPFPGVPPSFPPPPDHGGYGGYGGGLQSYGQTAYGQPLTRPPYGPTPPGPPPGLPADPAAGLPAGQVAAPVWPTHPVPPQRPAVIGLAATLAVTASLQWIVLLSFCWLVATAGADQLGTSGLDGGIYHILNRFNYRMLDGLAWPLYGFPLASLVLGFLLLTRRSSARIAYTAVGVGALAWSAWWLRSDVIWWLAPAAYVAVAVLVLWTRPANRWYAWQPTADAAGGRPS